jgi:hypothetical protein
MVNMHVRVKRQQKADYLGSCIVCRPSTHIAANEGSRHMVTIMLIEP